MAVAGKGKKSQQKAQAKGVAVGKKIKTGTVVRVSSKATKATKSTKAKKTEAPAAKADAKAAKAAQPRQKREAEVKKPKVKKPKFVKPEVPKPEDLDKDLDSYMAAAPDPTLVA